MRRLAVGMSWNLAGQAAILALGLFLVPVLVRRLGAEGYALYGLLGVVAGYLSLLSCGAPSAAQKYVSEASARRDAVGLWAVLERCALLHTALVLAGAGLVFLFREELVTAFVHAPEALRADAVRLASCGAAAAVFFSWTLLAVATLQGLQRFGLANAVQLAQSGLPLAGAAVLLLRGRGLPEIGIWFAFSQALVCAAGVSAALSLLPPRPAKRAAAPRGLWALAGSAFLAQLAWSATFQWDKAIIARLFPLAQLAYYMVPSFLVRRFSVVTDALIAASLPVLSELEGRGDRAGLRLAYLRANQLILAFMVPTFGLLFALAPWFLGRWLGPDFAREGALTMRLLIAAAFLHQLGSASLTASFAVGKPIPALYWQLAQAFLTLAGWLVLVPRHGAPGAALALLAAQALTAPVFALFVGRRVFGPAYQ